MRVIFMGTPDFAVFALRAVAKAGHTIVGVLTQPDKPKGRGYVLTPPPVKSAALELGLEVHQPGSMKTPEALELIKGMNADVAVVVAYGKILPQSILDTPKHGCINIHASILPKYRGAAPIQWAIINGETESGVTTMQMDAGIDTGDILLVSRHTIGENETGGELHDALAELGAELITETLERLEKGTLEPQKQDDSLSCNSPMLDREVCALDFSQSAQALHNRIRALNPWPSATAMLGGKRFKLHRSSVSAQSSGAKCGEIISLSPLLVACGDGSVLEILELQAEGGKRLSAEQYLRGHSLPCGERFC